MKFRNPETGEIENDINAVGEKYCNIKQITTLCKDCELERLAKSRGFNSCVNFQNAHPHEAARLMGYEVVEDEPIGRSGPVGPKGMPGLCPKCGKYEGLEWDRKTDASCCNLCGWTDRKEANMDNPCIGCDVGWESISTAGSKSCRETCEKFKAWEAKKKIDKPLKDWTLGELSDYCKKVVDPDGNCFNCEAKKYIGLCPFEETAPCDWDFEVKPRFTEQDVEDAKYIKRILKVDLVSRNQYGNGLVAKRDNGSVSVVVNSEMFPSIRPGQSYTLDEIIGGAE